MACQFQKAHQQKYFNDRSQFSNFSSLQPNDDKQHSEHTGLIQQKREDVSMRIVDQQKIKDRQDCSFRGSLCQQIDLKYQIYKNKQVQGFKNNHNKSVESQKTDLQHQYKKSANNKYLKSQDKFHQKTNITNDNCKYQSHQELNMSRSSGGNNKQKKHQIGSQQIYDFRKLAQIQFTEENDTEMDSLEHYSKKMMNIGSLDSGDQVVNRYHYHNMDSKNQRDFQNHTRQEQFQDHQFQLSEQQNKLQYIDRQNEQSLKKQNGSYSNQNLVVQSGKNNNRVTQIMTCIDNNQQVLDMLKQQKQEIIKQTSGQYFNDQHSQQIGESLAVQPNYTISERVLATNQETMSLDAFNFQRNKAGQKGHINPNLQSVQTINSQQNSFSNEIHVTHQQRDVQNIDQDKIGICDDTLSKIPPSLETPKALAQAPQPYQPTYQNQYFEQQEEQYEAQISTDPNLNGQFDANQYINQQYQYQEQTDGQQLICDDMQQAQFENIGIKHDQR